MYECYSKLNDGSNSFTNTISQRQFISIKCVHELKALGYKSNLEKFSDDHCNKIDILKMIWQRNAQNPFRWKSWPTFAWALIYTCRRSGTAF